MVGRGCKMLGITWKAGTARPDHVRCERRKGGVHRTARSTTQKGRAQELMDGLRW